MAQPRRSSSSFDSRTANTRWYMVLQFRVLSCKPSKSGTGLGALARAHSLVKSRPEVPAFASTLELFGASSRARERALSSFISEIRSMAPMV
eukprot:scaffold7589_cov286-Pinguiococcus_pyrenoidosus.AAC.1